MVHKKKSIFYKPLSILVLTAVFIFLIIILSNMTFLKLKFFHTDVSYTGETNLGRETFINIEKDLVKLSCNDALELYKLYSDTISYKLHKDNKTGYSIDDVYKIMNSIEVSEKNINAFWADLRICLDNLYGRDKKGIKKSSEIFYYMVNEINNNIVLLSFLSFLNLADKKEIDKFIEIRYCGAQRDAGYHSPLDKYYEMINKKYSSKPVDKTK